MLQIRCLTLGPFETNTYLIADDQAGEAVVIDPAWDGPAILAETQSRGWRIGQIWITHAHFDHFSGVDAVSAGCTPPPSLALHPDDLPLWRAGGGSDWFGIPMHTATEPDVPLRAGQLVRAGQYQFEVRHTPGHSLGHVVFYCPGESVAFCGDTVFAGGIGRTDLPGGDEETLLASIHSQILTLPDETRLLCGHGVETTVGEEKHNNLFLR